MDALDDLLVKRYQQVVSEKPKPLSEGFASTDPFVALVQATTQGPVASAKNQANTEVSSATDMTEARVTNESSLVVEEKKAEEIAPQDSTSQASSLQESTAEESEAVQELKPAWEVDRFLWPAICGDVEEHLESDLQATVEGIRAESVQRGHRLIAVLNSEVGDGATTVTMCLAREAARQSQRVAVVDLNNRRPGLMDNLGIDCEQGIESLQLADVDVEDICVSAIEDGVTLVPLLKPVDVEYGAGQGVRDLLDRLSQTHDLVLLDTTAEIVQRLANESPQLGIGLIVVSKSNSSNESVVDSSALKSLESNPGSSWNLGTVKNFAA